MFRLQPRRYHQTNLIRIFHTTLLGFEYLNTSLQAL